MLAFIVSKTVDARDFKCAPTPEDSLGPFYKVNTPTRTSVGEGYVLSGTVKSASDCSIISGAKIELWLAGPDGSYDDEHRAIIQSDKSGEYTFKSNVPPKYNFRPAHIHIRVTAANFKPLVTQHYPIDGAFEGDFPLVLQPL